MADRWGIIPTSAEPLVAATGAGGDTKRSNGIDPSLFHKKRRKGKEQTAAEKQLNQLLSEASKNEVVQKRKEYSSTQNNQRDVYHDITSLKTFPLQDLALSYLEELQGTAEKPPSASKKQKTTPREIYTAEFLSGSMTVLWSMEPRIFAEETSATGKRKYIAGHLGRFLQHYWRERDPLIRHCYELIREGTPCRMYFDLEFCKLSNPQISSNESEVLMTEFIAELCCEFQLVHDIQIDRSCIVDLDSTTEKKFSRHLIVHLPNQQLFADAKSAGVFAKTFVERLAHELSIGTLSQRRQTLTKHLFVNQKPTNNPNESNSVTNRETCFVDLGVYTKNRLFRILGSTKFGKPSCAALRIAAANEFPFPEGFDNSKFYHVDKKMDLKDAYERDLDSFRAALSWDAHADALAATLVVPANASTTRFNIIDGPTQASSEFTTSASLTRRSTSSRGRNSSGHSPMPKLDNYFLATLGRRGGVQGKIRAWSIECVTNETNKPNTYFLTYQMCENRWCENICRSHRSNNIMWTIDLADYTCWQQCHDPDCRQAGFRGRPLQLNLPEDVKIEVEDFLLEQEIAALDEKKVLNEQVAVESDLDFGDEEFDKELATLTYD
jgi:hypothetical protein